MVPETMPHAVPVGAKSRREQCEKPAGGSRRKDRGAAEVAERRCVVVLPPVVAVVRQSLDGAVALEPNRVLEEKRDFDRGQGSE